MRETKASGGNTTERSERAVDWIPTWGMLSRSVSMLYIFTSLRVGGRFKENESEQEQEPRVIQFFFTEQTEAMSTSYSIPYD